MVIRIGLIGLLLCSAAVFAQTPDPCATAPQTCATLIETHATSEMRIPNTVVDVVVGVSASGKDLPEVHRVLADHSNRLLAYLKAQQVDRLMTTFVNFSLDTRSQRSGPDKTGDRTAAQGGRFAIVTMRSGDVRRRRERNASFPIRPS